MNVTNDGTYTVDEVVAKFPGMTEHWLKKAVREDRVPHLRVNRFTILFTADHIEQLARSFEVKPRK